jgi:two-component system sensor histidine kinase/response regulator
MSAHDPIHILYLEDDPGLARLFQKRLERLGYVVDLASDGEQGLSMYAAGSYDIVAVDHTMPVYNGLEVMRRMADHGPLPPVIMITGTGSEEVAVAAMKLGAQDYIVKDVDGGYLELLPTVIQRVLNQQQLVKEKAQAEAALQRYAAELETRNEELDAFAHTVAHDLKGPLSNLAGFASLLAAQYPSMPDDVRQDAHERIMQSALRMGNIIDSLLVLASVRQQEEVQAVPLDMAAIVREVLERLAYLVEQNHAEVHVPPDWPVALGNDSWVAEVWANYISNAIKYGGQPPRVELGADVQEDGMVRFWVRDNGQGLSAQEQAKLFVPFTRLSQVQAKGHGLGLSIVRRIAERLGGQVGVESQVGQGSTFFFTLPESSAGPESA